MATFLAQLARVALWLAVASALAAALSGLGYRFGAWSLGMGFGVLRWATYGAIAAALLGLLGAIATRPGSGRPGFAQALIGLVIAIATFSLPIVMLERAKQAAPIHDITTDVLDPPRFVAVLPVRAGAPNSAEYEGARIAALQQKAYPRVVPWETPAPPAAAFERALAVARAFGWDIVASVPAEGRIEATDTTLWFGFKDDIVVRVTPTPSGSRVDVRSVSRVGDSDIGTNARRIERYLKALQTGA